MNDAQDQYLSVSQLTKYIKAKFDRDPYMQSVHLVGEVSGFRNRGKNKHQYFGLKDDDAYISAIIFRGTFSKLNFDLEDGMKVQVIGRLSLYEKTGRYSIIIDHIQPDGIGQFYVRFEQLKQKLGEEGLFTFEAKPIPKYPKRIAVVTSPSGAVIRDIITTARRRYPVVQIVLYPTVVQGQEAAKSIVRNIERADSSGAYDTIIVGRGGGSIEDLWCFNEEEVVRAIAACQTPVISSIGHETDTTLSDYVSDQRAATPTAAAELATPVLNDLVFTINDYKQRLIQIQLNRLNYFKQRLEQVKSSYLFKQPEKMYDGYRLKLADLDSRLNDLVSNKVYQEERRLRQIQSELQGLSPKVLVLENKHKLASLGESLRQGQGQLLERKHYQLQQLAGKLDLLSPLKRLSGGYVYLSKNQVPIESVDQVAIGDKVQLRLADGYLNSQIIGSKKEALQPLQNKENDNE
ncbi:exodeoxyribonuclease VII large subunit [Aerococcus sp. Group 1]|uniref:exodeoxyribonuclease VII large subunit n=1 Tax=Aerococcus urinae (strain CCUG 59500 / ACS-120-V-Col10a) TaxID=2976812 RepID=UPI00227CCF20|nr:exodeoxyribonuclease VII large subunit [Aerococcus sp. Group 1]MCY3030571.1 exodeoxyribonuclease VII large subunit [Aerococcus sp. Group 1]